MSNTDLNLIYEAKETIKDVAIVTPLNDCSYFAKDFSFYIKMESLQKTGSFKLRGAYFKMSNLSEEEKRRGVIAASAGNHAQGVAYSAKKLGISATIVMPITAPLQKINSTKSYGCEVVLHGTSFIDAYEHAKLIASEKNYTFIEPYNDEYVIAGQGTIGLEILEQCPDVDVVFVPLGGGGLVSGIAKAIKELKPSCKVYGVEAENAQAMKKSIKANKIVAVKNTQTIADGIAVARPGDITFDICKQYLDGIVVISDEDIAKAILVLLEKAKIVSEGAGAISIAAAFSNKVDVKNKNVVSVLSGGNIDVTLLSRVIDFALIKSGRRVQIHTLIPDKPGELTKILHLIASTNANIVSVNQSHGSQEMAIGQCSVEIIMETFDFDHIQRIIELLEEKGYQLEID